MKKKNPPSNDKNHFSAFRVMLSVVRTRARSLSPFQLNFPFLDINYHQSPFKISATFPPDHVGIHQESTILFNSRPSPPSTGQSLSFYFVFANNYDLYVTS